jgi:antitoxin MazE
MNLATTELAKWGNSLALRIPKNVAETVHLKQGDRLTLSIAKDGSLVVRPARKRYTLEQLVSGITPKNRHQETNWGDKKGKEVW